jgi:hypothetical protein
MRHTTYERPSYDPLLVQALALLPPNDECLISYTSEKVSTQDKASYEYSILLDADILHPPQLRGLGQITTVAIVQPGVSNTKKNA